MVLILLFVQETCLSKINWISWFILIDPFMRKDTNPEVCYISEKSRIFNPKRHSVSQILKQFFSILGDKTTLRI